MKSRLHAVLCAVLLSAATAPRAPAQVPPPSQAQAALQQALQQQPGLGDVLRARIRESGLSADQIRTRLRASGYPATLLDSYLGEAGAAQAMATPGPQELAAIQALGLPTINGEAATLDVGPMRAPRRPPSDVFGVDVFQRTTTQFLPLLAGPVPPDYKLGPGDNLVLIMTGDNELAYSLQVTREGFILIPQVGQVFVSNLTLGQVRDLLYTRLGRVYSGVRRVNPTMQFDITVANVRANQVFVVGEVAQPGAYQISSLGTVLTALYAGGGVTERANMRRIEVQRLGKTVATLDLYDYLLEGDTHSDIRLETGDVIFVPVHGPRITIAGAVLRPAIYELTAGETLGDLIKAAGGFRADAALRRVSVERIVPPEQRAPGSPPRMVVEVSLTAGTVPPFELRDGDEVRVEALAGATRNFVQIRGSVYQPGRYGLEPGMRLSRLVRQAGGFRPATYAGRAHIERLNPADSTRYVVAVELPADSAAPWSDDPRLEEYDIVSVYGRPEMREAMDLAITGMVNRPGRYPWREGMTLRDLVLMARGPRIGADLREAEIARLPSDRSRGQLATTVRVALDSTYLFDRDSLGRSIGPPGVAFPGSGTAAEVPLEPFDNVLIFRQPDFELQRTVTITGEVRYPGTYALQAKDDRLVDLLRRAGGLTPRSYLEGIRFVRPLANAGRVNIDLPRALRDTTSRDNVILQPGDEIMIPEYQPSVKVVGAVNSPGSVLYRQGAGLGYYLSAAGGFNRVADKGHVSVRFANGEVRTKGGRFLFFGGRAPAPGPGSEVFVPAKDPNEPRTDMVALFGAIAQIVASTIAIIVVVRR